MTPSTNQLPARALACLNSLTHGGAAQTLFIPGENTEDFYNLLEDIFKEHQPASMHTAGIATDAVLGRWFLTRRQRAFADNEAALFNLKPNQAEWTADDLHRLDLFDRYKTQAERAFRRAFVNLQAIRKETNRELHWQAMFELQKQRFAQQTEKFNAVKEREAYLAAELAEKERQDLEKNQAVHRLQKRLETETFLGQPVVRQHIWFNTHKNNITKIKFMQSNDEIRNIIAASQCTGRPIEVVARHYHVVGELPAQLDWLHDEAGEPSKFMGAAEYIQNMKVDTFVRISADEANYPSYPVLNHVYYEEEGDDRIIRVAP